MTIPSCLGRIVTRDGYAYQITPDDVLWLARSVHKEGGNHTATIWTYLQRQAAGRRSSSLASLVLAHSQPVNPRWRADGEFCRPGGEYAGSQYCTPQQLEARAANAVRPWSQIPQSVRDAVVSAVTARTPNPVPNATDFADPTVSAGFLRRNPEARVVLRAGNWYIDERRVSSPVEIELDGRRVGAAAGGVGLALAAALVAGYAVWRRLR
jgi:hypothetical protein